jgi:ribosomal protein L7/L12
MFGMLFGGPDVSGLEARLARVERKLDLLLKQLGIEQSEDGMQGVRDLVAAGKKIEAVKAYREKTGAGLREALEAVERGV